MRAILHVPAGALAAIVTLLAVAVTSCGGGSSVPSEPTPPTGPPSVTNTITILASGATPQNIQIAAGTRVLFVNNDSRAHNMSSDPHPEHTDCPELNLIGLLAPGQSRETGNLNSARTCRFHDHDLPSDTRLQGRIIIQ